MNSEKTIAAKTVGSVLVELGKLSQEDLNRARKAQLTTGEPLDSVLDQLGLVSSHNMALALSLIHGVHLVSADDFPDSPLVIDGVSNKFLRASRALPIARAGDTIVLAMADPAAAYVVDAVHLATGLAVSLRVAAGVDIDAAHDRHQKGESAAAEPPPDDIGASAGDDADEDIQHLRDLAREAPVIRLVNQIITEAAKLRASDIHIEPFRDSLKLRYRIDGVLREMAPPPIHLGKAIVSRIKIMAQLNIAERRLPQDGRARFAAGGRQIDLRVATLPTIFGERAAIRLLDDGGGASDFAALGLSAGAQKVMDRVLAAPHGMILVTGPTGSGKTTLLYAALRQLNQPGRNILTVEDPVEYQIVGVNQIQVKPDIGLTFAHVLRSFVRHDPDVIMVGEMRDGETAGIAVHAALTGHLVVTTLHTNSAAASLARLVDMGIEPFLLASTIRVMIAQRLVRRLCTHCRQPYPPNPEFLAFAERHGLAVPPDAVLFRAIGCDACAGIGYAGRMGVFELIEMDDAIRGLVRHGANATEIEGQARKRGFVPMFADGLGKCLAGITTIEEVGRVTEDW